MAAHTDLATTLRYVHLSPSSLHDAISFLALFVERAWSESMPARFTGTDPGFIYFVRDGRFIKIGWAKVAANRSLDGSSVREPGRSPCVRHHAASSDGVRLTREILEFKHQFRITPGPGAARVLKDADDTDAGNKVRSPASTVRLRALLALGLAMLSLLAILASASILDWRNRRTDELARTAASVDQMLVEQSAEAVAIMRTMLSLILQDETLKAAFRTQDRKTLLELSTPILNELRGNHQITHFYYILPDGTALLRVHAPDKHGDEIQRRTLQDARRTAKPAWGYEQGPRGTFTLRVVLPWVEEGVVLGFVELGIEFAEIMTSIKRFLDVDVFVAADKRLFDRAAWDEAQQHHEQAVSWDEFPAVVVLSRTASTIPEPIKAYLRQRTDHHAKRTFEIAWNGTVAQTIVVPFSDLQDRQVGEVVVVHDITAEASNRRRTVLWVMTLGALLGGTLLLFFYVLLGRVQRDTAERTTKLGKELEARARAEAALSRSEEQLRQSQKMEAVGRLAGGVAHDFNNLLSVILGYSKLILADLEPGAPFREDLQEIDKAGERAADLTRQLLMFSRQQVLAPRVLDLNELLSGMNKLLRRVIGEDVLMVSTHAQSLGKVNVDPGSIEQVIMNLVVNARDAMPTGGKLTIETANTTLDDAYAREHLGAKAGPHVLLAVSDSGIGMDRATQARIFEPFFTTKAPGKGTGLGLSTVFGIVQQSGGSVWVYSEPGKGTSFKVYLPVVEGAVDDARHEVAPAILGGTETILLVEDAEQVRGVARRILERGGYHVVEAPDGNEAFSLAEKHAGTINLLLSDVVMPHTSGPELARRLAEVRPEMAVIFMSGYTDDSVVRHGVLEGHLAFLQKPIAADALLRKVREVLDGPKAVTRVAQA